MNQIFEIFREVTNSCPYVIWQMVQTWDINVANSQWITVSLKALRKHIELVSFEGWPYTRMVIQPTELNNILSEVKSKSIKSVI